MLKTLDEIRTCIRRRCPTCEDYGKGVMEKMNKMRRKSLSKIMDRLDDLRIDLEYIKLEEEECLENMLESLKGSERYKASDMACRSLNTALINIEDAISFIEQAAE